MQSYYQECIQHFCSINQKILQDLKDKNILITGASGLIGSFLIDVLLHSNIYCKLTILYRRRNKKIISLEKNKKVLLIQHDLQNSIPINDKIDYIFHLASPTDNEIFIQKPFEIINFISQSTQRICEFAQKNKALLLYASSSEVYGEISEQELIRGGGHQKT